MRTGILHSFCCLLALEFAVACGGDGEPTEEQDDDATAEERDADTPARSDASRPDGDDDDDDDGGDDDDVEPGDGPPKRDAAAGAGGSTPDGSVRADGGKPAEAPPDAGMTAPPAGPSGPQDGDPGKPVVAIDGIPCRDPATRAAFGRSNFMFDGRQMIVDYPCNKREGAPVTFLLNLHGTTPVEQHFYQWGYFGAWRHVASHNLVVVTPSSVVQQWGNMDNGVDEPHLMKIIEWVYQTFGSKFDIRQMWVGGHSWGSFYTSRFGCKEELKDKVKGLILMSGASPPQCAARVSILNTSAALPNPERLLDQTRTAMGHGCDAMQMRAVDANNDETFWPGCDPGWVHANYMMKTKMHATSIDPSVVKSVLDHVQSVRP
jgi:hypothetical protein